MSEAEIEIVGESVTLRQGGKTSVAAALADVVREIAGAVEHPPSCGILPKGVRVWRERGDAVAVAVEVEPHARSARWLADGSRAHYGYRARYEWRFLAFPYVVLLLVFRRCGLTGWQQLYYRRQPLEAGEDLLLPNLFNVARGYGQRCWVCLVNLRDLSRLSWAAKIGAVVDHVFCAAFNRSSEVNEGNSYWSAMRTIDPRVASTEAWEQATRENPRFPLEVAWQPAGTTVSAELGAMLDNVVAPTRSVP